MSTLPSRFRPMAASAAVAMTAAPSSRRSDEWFRPTAPNDLTAHWLLPAIRKAPHDQQWKNNKSE
jgi:hypothetical protein